MVIKEITEQFKGEYLPVDIDNIKRRFKGDLTHDPKSPPKIHRAWEISIDGKTLILKRYGSFCCWDKFILEKTGGEVYRIEIKPHWESEKMKDIGTRTEFFDNIFFRAYQGNRFSFIEYLDIAGQTEKIPKRKELISAGLDKKLIKDYEEKLKQILSD